MKHLWVVLFVAVAFVARPVSAAEVQEVVGEKSGVVAWLVEDHSFPIVAFQFSFEGGSEYDPEAKQGLASLMADALTAGAGRYGAVAFQKQLADRSITLSFAAGRDEVSGGLKFLSADKDKAFDLLRLTLTQPRFEGAEVERLRERQRSGIRRQLSDPGWQARYALLSHVFSGHPYAQRSLGTMETLPAITPEDLRTFATRHMARDTLVVGVAGDIDAETLALALDSVFGALPEKAAIDALSDVADGSEKASILVRREGPQTKLLFAWRGPKRDDPDFYAAEVANYIVGGGGFTSRLMKELREKRGLTYGIATYLAPARHAGLVVGSASVDNAKVGEALRLIRKTVSCLYREGPSVEELAAAKDYLTGSMPLALTSTDALASLLVFMQQEALGADYLDRYGALIRGVAMDDVRRALERFFNPDRMTVVMVGAPENPGAATVKDLVKK